MNFETIFENNDIIIIHKPALTLTVPSRMGEEDERTCLGTDLQKQLGQQIYPVHRLDYEVSGMVIFAKNPEAHKISNLWFEHKTIQKVYSAMTEGNPPIKAGEHIEWKCKLLRGKKRSYESPHGKDSLTKAKLIEKRSEGWLWELEPVTGRSHQLRYEMYRHQCPILGDALYSSTKEFTPGIALKAFRLILDNIEPSKRLGLPPKIEIKPF